jgi:calcineurin-like phosphoesterase family protein
MSQGFRRRILVFGLLLLGGACAAPVPQQPQQQSAALSAPAEDGPYVWPTNDGWIARRVLNGVVRDEVLKAGSLAIAGIGVLPTFVVELRPPAPKAAESVAGGNAPLFVLADTHGEYEIAVEMLQRQRVIDSKLRWTFGRGRLVVLGDVLDRGPHQIEILWLLYKLEAEAAAAGGGMHLILGNHEAMVLTGDLRYLHAWHRPTAQTLGLNSYADLLDSGSVLGQWLRSKPAMLRIGRLLFVHGGVSRALVDSRLTLSEINAAIREAMAGGAMPSSDRAKTDLVMKRLGPLWYRGYFPGQSDFPQASLDDVDGTMAQFGVCRIFVGHTIVPTVTPLFGGKVIAVQVYPHRDVVTEKYILEAVVVAGDLVFRARIDGGRELLELPTPQSARRVAAECAG